MDPERWERIKELFEAALEQDAGKRSAFLAEACAGNDSLRADVERLLSGHDRAGSFLKDGDIPARNLLTGAIDETPHTFSPDELLCGRFKVTRFLCKGGMGEVYEARDLELGGRVALKTIRPEIAANPETIRRFKHEIQLALKVTHSNVCRIFDLEYHRVPSRGNGADTEVAFLTMELLEGETLSDRLRRQSPMSTAEAMPLVRQMAEALAAAHDAGVIHRDFKPSNVILVASADASGPHIRAVVTDFGLARGSAHSDSTSTESGQTSQSSMTSEGTLVGTLAYMAPEQISGGCVTPATDIYALGLVMYEMVTGHKPFSGQGPLAGAAKRATEPAPSPCAWVPDLDPRWETAILRCLEIDPALRFQTAREVLQELDREYATARVATGSAVDLHPVVWPPRRRKARLASVLGSLALAVALASVGLNVGHLRDRLRAWFGHPTGIKSLAVLPLENLSGSADQDYFADGMTDELITDLGKIGALRVISRTSVMQYKGTHKQVSDVARALNVDAVVEGTVRRSGNQVLITARLIDARTDGGIWGESYEREERDVLALQSEVARAIADEIRIKVTSQDQKRLAVKQPVNTDAYEAYLRGRFYWNQRTEDGLRTAIGYFQEAIAKDPSYALPHVGIADCYNALGNNDYLPHLEAFPKAKAEALRALEMDENLAEAHASLAFAIWNFDFDWGMVESEYKRAIELNPGYATTYHWYAGYLSGMGRHEEAIAAINKARELDPLSTRINANVGFILYCARQYDQAIVELRKAQQMDPKDEAPYLYLGLVYVQKRDYPEAMAAFERYNQVLGGEAGSALDLAYGYAATGQRQEAEKMLDRLVGDSKQTYQPPLEVARVYTALGKREEAFTWLERAYEQRSTTLLRVDPSFDSLRSDPRFQALLVRMKLQS